MFQQFLQVCGYKGCESQGIHKAPKSRHHIETGSHDWHWFCLTHIRDYNAKWNYYQNMSESEIERERRADVTWQRPSWPLGASHPSKVRYFSAQPIFQDPFELFKEETVSTPSSLGLSPEEKALSLLGLSIPFSQKDLRQRYRDLVKQHHPDVCGGNIESEDKLKEINEAYGILKAYLGRYTS